jgi:tetratricopeptide (TPR) repeat protein
VPGEPAPALLAGPEPDVHAPTCDDLLAAEPRDAKLAYDHVQDGHRELVRGNWDLAERAFCRAVRAPDASASTRFELAQALLIRRDSAAAAAQAREVLALDPSSKRALELLGDALVRMGDAEKACRIWLDASKLSRARMGQRDWDEAEQATLQRDFVRAERFYRRVTGCQPDHALAQANLAATLAKLGQTGSARHWAQRALQLAPNDRAVQAAIPTSLR